MPTAQPTPVTVLILSPNEEANIGQCLDSLQWAAEVLIVDALSTDRTVEIARNRGAVVHSHPFEGYARQRNWALTNLPISNDWVLFMDADEVVPPALAEEIRRAVTRPNNQYAGYYLDRRFYFFDRRLKHGGLSPNWILRLYRRDAAGFEERPLDEHIILKGKASRLPQPFDHRDLRPLATWVTRHNRYADLQAQEYVQEKFLGGYQDSIKVRLSGTQAERRRWIKLHLWMGLPLLVRPFLYFFRNYVPKGGFLDGKPGFIYHVLWSFWYRFLADVKILEIQKGAGASTPERLAQDTAKAGINSNT